VNRALALLRELKPGFLPGLAAGVALAGLLAAVLLGPGDEPQRLSAIQASPAPVGTSSPRLDLKPSAAPEDRAPAVATASPQGTPGNSDDNDRDKDDEEEGATVTGPVPPFDGPPAPLPRAEPVTCPDPTFTVRTAEELTRALDRATPGQVIALRDGTYSGNFVATASGTEDSPIWLCGGPGAVIDAGGTKKGYGLHLAPARYWRVVGFTVRNAQKGVVADATRGTVLQGLTVEDIGDEAIHLRSFSTGSAVIENTVRRTGLRKDKFGEGVYVGSANSNWGRYSGGQPDRSDNNLVHRNRISETGSESVDVKEGTTGGVVSDNAFDGAGMTGADSWVDIKGNGWTITGNTGRNTPLDGFQTHEVLDGWGTGNTFRGNTADVDPPGFAFHFAPPRDNVAACDNHTSRGAPASSKPACRN
jgi:hypothetical protein